MTHRHNCFNIQGWHGEGIDGLGGYKVLRRELRDRYRKRYEQERQGKVESWGAV